MNGPIDNHDEVHSMSERGSPPPTTNTRMTGSGSGVLAEEESPARHRHPQSRDEDTQQPGAGGAEAARPSAQLRGSCPRDAGGWDDPPAYEMICLPTEESGAVPPHEVIPGDTAPNQREDQPSESGGLSRI